MLDEKDRIIIEELKKDAKQPIMKLSRKVGLPRTTVGERIRKLIDKKIIKKFTVMLDYEKVGLPITTFILVSFLPNPEISQRELAKRISKMENVWEVYIVSGEWDLIVKVRGKSMEEIGQLIIDKLRAIKGVGKTVTCTCFTTVTENI
ncbi:MAG: Lrp/AsnC family transcriptional regulator [Candidatus Thermoplasmatota archaeon]|nr:Lrp/AsnC family transcriptional regulator [Candidatus Thermoplasmatota archaeon]